MVHFIDYVLVPYVQSTRAKLSLDKDHFALALFDIFAAHRCKTVLQALEENNIKCCFIPAHCRGELYSLDLTVNKVFKQGLKAYFIK